MTKTSVYLGEVVGFTVGKLFDSKVYVLSIKFDTLDDAQGYCDSMIDRDSASIYFPIKLTAMSNTYVPDKVYN